MSDYRTARLALAALALAAVAQSACVRRPAPIQWPDFGGDPGRGAALAERFGCGACHEMPDIEGAVGEVGPPLATFGRRTMIAGVLPNTPANLVTWLRHPQRIVPGNAMPDTGLTDAESRDLAAYLYRKR